MTEWNVVVFFRCSRILDPAALNAQKIGHGVQFFSGVGQHVAHHHAPEGPLRIIDIDSHFFTFGFVFTAGCRDIKNAINVNIHAPLLKAGPPWRGQMALKKICSAMERIRQKGMPVFHPDVRRNEQIGYFR